MIMIEILCLIYPKQAKNLILNQHLFSLRLENSDLFSQWSLKRADMKFLVGTEMESLDQNLNLKLEIT